MSDDKSINVFDVDDKYIDSIAEEIFQIAMGKMYEGYKQENILTGSGYVNRPSQDPTIYENWGDKSLNEISSSIRRRATAITRPGSD